MTTTAANLESIGREASAETDPTQLINQLQTEKSHLKDNLVELEEQLKLLEENSAHAKESEEEAELAKLKAEEVLAEATEMLYQVEKIKDSASAILDLLANILSSFDRQRRSADDIISPATCAEMLATIGRMNAALQMGTKEGLKEGSEYAVVLLRTMTSPSCTFHNNADLVSAQDGLAVSLASVAQVVAEEKEAVSVVAADLVASVHV